MQENGGGQTDDRYLWHEMLKVIDQVRPMWVIGENVNGITTMVESFEVAEMGSESSIFNKGNGIHRYRSEQTFTIERICSDLESKGYSVQPMLIPACAVAAPHRRDRIFILACNAQCSRLEVSFNRGTEAKVFEEQTSKGKVGSSKQYRFFTTEGFRGFASDSDYDRRNEVYEHIQSELADGTESICNGRIGDVARMLPGNRWKGFPSVSPVHRGNDGLPFDVDNLTISFSKWRAESLKAYGNAIVPQVIYQIMKVINDISTNNF